MHHVNKRGPLAYSFSMGVFVVLVLLVIGGCSGRLRYMIEEGGSQEALLEIRTSKDVNEIYEDGQTPLVIASRLGKSDLVRALIYKGADVNAADADGKTPLHVTNDFEVAKLLVEHGADVDARDAGGRTPLHDTYNTDIARLLVEHGADMNARNNDGETFLHAAIDRKFEKKYIIDGEVSAYSRGREAVAVLLVERGADVNARDSQGHSPLHDTGSWNLTRLFVEHGADVKARDNDGNTPLHGAPNLNSIKLFVKKGADVDARNNNGETPLHMAAMLGSFRVVKLLHESGADINATTNNGYSALKLAYDARKFEVVDFLLSLNADDRFDVRGPRYRSRREADIMSNGCAPVWNGLEIGMTLSEAGSTLRRAIPVSDAEFDRGLARMPAGGGELLRVDTKDGTLGFDRSGLLKSWSCR